MVQERRHADPIPQWLTWFRAIRTLAPLGVVLVMFTALAAILLRVPEPAKTVAEWALPLSAVELGVSSITVQIRDIRLVTSEWIPTSGGGSSVFGIRPARASSSVDSSRSPWDYVLPVPA